MADRQMGNQARRSELLHVIEVLNEPDGAERYRFAQRPERNGKPAVEERAHPLEYDRNGFPAPQPRASFGARVRRLRGA
jgi:hypothetical protein